MDGVIVDTNPFHKQAIHEFCSRYGFNLSEDQLRSTIYGRTNKDWITNLFGKLTAQELEKYASEKEQLFRDLYEPFIKPVAGLIDFLGRLQQSAISCAIATSAPPANVEFVLKHIPIRNYFKVILDERSVMLGKPHPEVYLNTARALSLPNAQCVVIEDSLSGIAAARSAGSKVIGLTTTHTAEELKETDLVLNSFNGLSVGTVLNLVQGHL